MHRLGSLFVVAMAMMAFGLSAKAQTATLLATNQYVFVGANFNGIYTNSQLRATLSGTGVSPVTVSVAGAPAGVTILFSTNAYVAASNPLVITNSWNPIWYSVAVTNVAKGVYPLTFTCSGAASASAVVNLIVGARWISSVQVGSATDVPWSTGANWSTGVAPGAGDDVIFQDAGNTNRVDSSVSIDSLTFIPVGTGTNQNLLISPGQTLSVTGTNSFTLNTDSYTTLAKVYLLNIFGPGASLVVSNKQGIFSVNSCQGTGGATSGMQLNMTNLDNFSATVDRFGLGDWSMVKAGGVAANELATASGANGVQFARTNYIEADYAGNFDLTNFNLTFAISLLKEGDAFNNGSQQNINLGMNTAIRAESFAFAQNKAGSGNNIFRFNPVFASTSLASMPYVSFRNTNGGRMNLVAVGVESGTSGHGSNTRGALNFTGGIVDMLVDTIWLGRNKTASVATNTGSLWQGQLIFNAGTVDVNNCIAGYQAYTNNGVGCQGVITVGGSAATTAVLIVNSNLTLGYTTGDFNGTAAAAGNGQVTINTNGTVKANQITVGDLSLNNAITINNGGTLEVGNTVASPAKSLRTLTVNKGGAVTLNINGANTLIYVTNLVASSGVVNIASITGSSPTIPVITYAPGAGETASFVAGNVPGGYSAVVFNNTSEHAIKVALITGTPKTLLWRGYVNNKWDNSTANWLDTATLLHTNFATGDGVVFDDLASFSSIDVSEDVVPRQSLGFDGMTMTNNTLDYTFSGVGGIRGAASFVKAGAKSLTINNYTEVSAQVLGGLLTGSGTIGSVVVSPGATGSLLAGGVVLGNLTCGGTVVNAGTVQGALAVQTLAVVTNAAGGIVQGPLSTADGCFIYNAGTFSGMGTATIVSNATFINAGTLANGSGAAGTLAVSGTFKDMGLAAGTVVNLSNLTINAMGTFIPGGDGIGTTKVLNDGTSANNGRVVFLTGSTNIFKVDLSASPSSTLLQSGYMSFGPNQNTLQQNGGTIKLVQIGGPAYAAGQSLTLVQNNFGGAPFDVGLNTTNSLSVMDPSVPATGLAWDLSQLIHGGIIGIKTIPTVPTNLVFSSSFAQTISTNVPPVTNNYIVMELSWPADYTGWKLQQQQNPLEVGLSTNWTEIAAAQFTNDIILSNSITAGAVFYRMVAP